jgi:hypothetical protein
MAEPVLIKVTVVPMEPTLGIWAIECSDCGTVGTVNVDESDEVCLTHLELHKVDTTAYRNNPKFSPTEDQPNREIQSTEGQE